MDVNDVIAAYIEKFGGWPMYLFMSADDTYIIETLRAAIDRGIPVTVDDDAIY